MLESPFHPEGRRGSAPGLSVPFSAPVVVLLFFLRLCRAGFVAPECAFSAHERGDVCPLSFFLSCRALAANQVAL